MAQSSPISQVSEIWPTSDENSGDHLWHIDVDNGLLESLKHKICKGLNPIPI